MKKISFYAIAPLLLLIATISNAQVGIINTVATLPGFPNYLALDASGNMYVSDWQNHVVRKVSCTGSVSLFAGNGVSGSSGDGGPATAAELMEPYGIAIDATGNVYVADRTNSKIRKINPSGIITTFAGTGTYGFSGDNGQATAAKISQIQGISIDASGNFYIADYNNYRIRKITSSGIITTIAGSGAVGNSGDGGPATAAGVNAPIAVTADYLGNIYITTSTPSQMRKVNTSGIISSVAWSTSPGDAEGLVTDATGNIYVSSTPANIIYKVDTSGVITTIAGIGTAGFSGDGGPATAAKLSQPWGLAVDPMNNIYFADYNNFKIRKIVYSSSIASSSFSAYVNKTCSGPDFFILTGAYSPSFSVKTNFGDGISNTAPILNGYCSGYANFTHAYPCAGTYNIKQVLLNGTVAIDSVSYSLYNNLFCQSIAAKFYYDTHGNCAYDSTLDPFINLPITIEVDSNGLAIDTVSATSGLYYTAYGNPGDIYTFRLINGPYGLQMSCPTAGAFSDTLSSVVTNSDTKYVGFTCNGASNFDLTANFSLVAGRHMATTNIIVTNTSCNPENGTVTMNISPKYVYQSSNPLPSSLMGNSVTWDISNISAIMPNPPSIHLSLSIPNPGNMSSWLTPGDTVTSMIEVSPFTGDINTSNNIVVSIDTIKSSFDPNSLSVVPEGHVAAGTTLAYTIHFENTGNDTAHNIYIMDTLSYDVDVKSVRLIATSAVMNVSILKTGVYHIARFEFPNINLLDSSHHDQCDGMLQFTVKTKSGLPNGSTVFNHVGIFFDDNPVVMTDTVENIIGLCSPVVSSFTDTGTVTRGFIYTGTITGIDSLKWNFGDGNTSTMMYPMHSYTTNGTYHVCVTVYTGCGNDTACADVVVSSVGLSSVVGSRKSIEVWPNPANNDLYIDNAANRAVHIYDLIDREVYKGIMASDHETIHICHLQKGVYFIHIVDISTRNEVIRKIVKE